MPMRAYKASLDAVATSTGHATAHVGRNKRVWMVIAAVVAAVGFYLNWSAPGREPSHWGDLGAASTMFLGILVMMTAQEGYVPPQAEDEDESADT